MPRLDRKALPGSSHHIYNRGVAQRPLFDDFIDRRLFLSLLAGQVHAGRLIVHAYCLMTNHFHLLVEVVGDELANAMREIERRYSRTFNRTRERDGPLFRSRYGSTPLDDERARRCALAYIDRNPVAAGLVESAVEYRWGSAWHFERGTAPPWLEQSWVTSVAEDVVGVRGASYRRYEDCVRRELDLDVDLVEARMSSRATWDPLVAADRAAFVAAWLRSRAVEADGVGDWLPIASAPRILERLEAARRRDGSWTHGPRGVDLWPTLAAGLLRDLAGLSITEAASRLALARSTAAHRTRLHRQLVGNSDAYRERATLLAEGAVWGRSAERSIRG